MEKELETNLMIIRFYKNFINDPIESILAYHSRRYEDDVLIDAICFASPNRCNVYGTNLTNINNINYDYSLDYETNMYDYIKISGFIDFLIYHRFITKTVERNKTLDDKENFKRAYDECCKILDMHARTYKLLPDSYDFLIYDIEDNFANIVKV